MGVRYAPALETWNDVGGARTYQPLVEGLSALVWVDTGYGEFVKAWRLIPDASTPVCFRSRLLALLYAWVEAKRWQRAWNRAMSR